MSGVNSLIEMSNNRPISMRNQPPLNKCMQLFNNNNMRILSRHGVALSRGSPTITPLRIVQFRYAL